MSTAPSTSGPLARAWHGVVWYLRAVSGEDRWDSYVRECEHHGHQPVTRREFERARADAAATRPVNRCC